eukprot:jgi/Tetstr1/449983/TSEL_037035.t1
MATARVPWADVPWAAASSRAEPPDIYGIGANYMAHVQELGRSPPTTPLVFPKATSSFNTGPYIVLPDPIVEGKVDYEGELGVVLGPEPCRNVSAADAMGCIYGFVIAHDVSGRHNQFEAPTGSQWSLSKSFDTFSSVQPEITLSTQISDPHALSLRTMLNGQVVQEGNTSDLIFKLQEIIAYLSRSTTLLPGTLIMTGTPPGPGHFRSPPVYLTPGDTVTVEIEGLGSLTHKVIAHDDPRAAGAI